MRTKADSFFTGILGAVLAGLAALPAAASYNSEIIFQESLRSFKRGEYKGAMLGFMDVLVEEPKNDLARQYLKAAGLRVLKQEDKETQNKRKQLLAEAERMRKRLAALTEAKEARLRDWDRLYSRAKSLAGDADSLREAVGAYEQFVRGTPVYSEEREIFLERVAAVRQMFYEAIKNKYPEMVAGRTGVDDADLAGVFFARDALNDVTDRYGNGRRTENVLARAVKIQQLRADVSELLDLEARAVELYSRGRYEEAAPFFKKVLKARNGNEEAVFYHSLSSERASAARLPEKEVVAEGPEPFRAAPLKAPGQAAAGRAPAAAKRRSAVIRSARPGRAPAVKKIGRSAPTPALPENNSVPAVRQNAGDMAAADELYEQGVREFSVGSYEDAAKSWEECLRLAPGHTKARLGLERLKSSGS